MVLLATAAWADSDDDGEHEAREKNAFSSQQAAPMSARYKQECSSCHFAYPANFLPHQSWTKIMNNLNHHFNENAELDAKTKNEITAYLLANASEQYVRDITALTQEKDIPIRITQTAHFKREHRKIPLQMVIANPHVKSFSNCQTCHTGAKRGSFSESGIRIPNYSSQN